MGARGGDWVAHAAVVQPASVAAVQLGEPPGRVQLPDLSESGSVLAARLGGLLEVQVAPDEVDPAWLGGEGDRKREGGRVSLLPIGLHA